jgi:hypothetical protein
MRTPLAVQANYHLARVISAWTVLWLEQFSSGLGHEVAMGPADTQRPELRESCSPCQHGRRGGGVQTLVIEGLLFK